MDDNNTTNHGPVHPDNGKLGVFINPLPSSKPRGCIGIVSTSHCLNYYFTHKWGCRNENSKNDGQGMKFNVANGMHHYSYTIHDMENVKIQGASLHSCLCKMYLGCKNTLGMQTYYLRYKNCNYSIH